MIDNIKKFLNEEQDPKAIEKIIEKLNGLLMSGEEVSFIAVQKRPAINISPDCIALTNKRIIFCRPKNIGLSLEFQDYVWKDIYDCHLKENIFGAEFTIRTVKGILNKIDYLPKVQARRLYTVAQEQEEIQKEYRRQRELEEKRAAAGSVNVTANIPTQQSIPSSIPAAKDGDPVANLKRLKSLLENQLITEDEYNAKKVEILSRL